jgi:outer membrane receptor for ferrienterochelin and colicins
MIKAFKETGHLPQRNKNWRCPLQVAVMAMLVLLPFSLCHAKSADEGLEPNSGLMEMSVEQLMSVEVATVYGASKYEQKVTEAPASVSIVTRDEIRRYGYRTLADALRSVRGIYVTYDRNYNYIGVRGFNRPGDYNSRVLLLVDGHRINDNIYDSAPIGTEFPVDVDLIDRIEVIRGPSSSLYGTNAFFGVINVITRQPGDLGGTELSASAGSVGTYEGRVSYGKEYTSGLGVLLSGSAMSSDGPNRLHYGDFQGVNGGFAEHADGDRNYRLYGKFSLRDFTLTGAYASRTKNVPTAAFATVFNDSRFQTTDAHGFLDLKYHHEFGDQTQLTARAFYDQFYYNGNYPGDANPDNSDTTVAPVSAPIVVLNKDLAWGTWWGGEVQLTKTLPGRHKVSLGTEFRDNSRQHQQNYDVAPYQLFLDDRRNSSIWALYLQDEFQILDRLILSAGVRYDHYDSFGASTNPRLALIYQPVEGSTLKLLYGSAFRAPNAYERFYNDQVNILSNPDLKPERIQTYEMIYEQYFHEHYRSSVSGFYYRVQDLITSEPVDPLFPSAPPSHYVNIDSLDAHGAELELEGKWQGGLEGKLSYTYQRVLDATTGANQPNSPSHLAKFNLTVPLYRNLLLAGFEEQYQSSRLTLGGNQTGASYLSNLTLSSRDLISGLQLSASVYNLFAARNSDPGSPNHIQDSIQQDGRTFRLKLDYRF